MKRFLIWLFVATSLLSASLVQAQWRYVDLTRSGDVEAYVFGVSATDQVGHSSQGYLCCFAAWWQGSAGSILNYSDAIRFYATDGANRAGFALNKGRFNAVVASGPSKVVTILSPAGKATEAIATSTWNGSFGGSSILNGTHRATYWPSIKTGIDMHPAGAGSSAVNAVSGNLQAGVVDGRAATWTGSAKSFVDRHPSGTYWSSVINGLDGSMAVGSAAVTKQKQIFSRAAVWNFAVGWFQTLHPIGYSESFLTGVSQGWSSGYVIDSKGIHRAGVWDQNGNFSDLHSVLPASTYGSFSVATSIWRGAGTYVGGYASAVAGGTRAILWYIPPD